MIELEQKAREGHKLVLSSSGVSSGLSVNLRKDWTYRFLVTEEHSIRKALQKFEEEFLIKTSHESLIHNGESDFQEYLKKGLEYPQSPESVFLKTELSFEFDNKEKLYLIKLGLQQHPNFDDWKKEGFILFPEGIFLGIGKRDFKQAYSCMVRGPVKELIKHKIK